MDSAEKDHLSDEWADGPGVQNERIEDVPTVRHALPSSEVGGPSQQPLDIRHAESPRVGRPGLRAPKDAPNVLLVVLDDMGFGGPSAFGGPCYMPTAERLAAEGLRYSRFHVNAMCSPTRQSLLTGRNSHSVGMGATTEFATSAPGYTAVRPASAATLAQVLCANGYSTAAIGKMHQTPQWEVSAVGPFDRWPTGEGFEKFYGFVGPEMNHWSPLLYDGTTPVEPRGEAPGEYHLSEDLADHAIAWLQLQHSLDPLKPFFLYLPMGACHAPLHVAPSWRERYRGKFSHGWDEQRQRTLDRQKELGVVPSDAVLSPWPSELPHWAELSAKQREVAEAFMETYAAVAEHVDAQVGRVVEALEQSGQLDNTLVMYLLGDNGASGEGGVNGTLNIERAYSGVPESTEFLAAHLGELGGPESYPLQPAGWSIAMSTPYQWTKQVASHFGGTRDGLVVRWPAGIGAVGEIRHQWHHVIDVFPTILDVVGVPAPDSVNGVAQQRIDGMSMAYTFEDAEAPSRRTTQYFEMLGNRAIYHEGWIASVKHRTPWDARGAELPDFATEDWQLYDLEADWSQARDIADQHPRVLRALQDLFVAEAARNNVFPLDDRSMERMNADLAPRPDLADGRTTMVLHPNARRLYEDAVINVKNKSHRVIASVDTSGVVGDGVIIAQGGRFGGWALHMVDGCAAYTYNYFGLDYLEIIAPDAHRPGRHLIEISFEYAGGGLGQAATLVLSVDGESLAQGTVGQTTPYLFSSHETMDVGVDLGTAVDRRYDTRSSEFDGSIVEVRIEVLGAPSPEAPGGMRRKLAHQ